MARVNITVPDELVEQARAAGLNVSRLASSALAEELDRLARTAALDVYLAELEAELGPIPLAEAVAAQAWADGLFTPAVLLDAGPLEPRFPAAVNAGRKARAGEQPPRSAPPRARP